MEKALPNSFFFPDDARFDTERQIARDKVVFGIDVSHHNGNKLNLAMLLAQKVDFVYAKATQGVKFKSEVFLLLECAGKSQARTAAVARCLSFPHCAGRREEASGAVCSIRKFAWRN